MVVVNVSVCKTVITDMQYFIENSPICPQYNIRFRTGVRIRTSAKIGNMLINKCLTIWHGCCLAFGR